MKIFNNPLFIVSNSRAGSTAMKLALATHPQIMARGGEAPLLSSIANTAYLLEHDVNAEYFNRDLRIPSAKVKTELKRLCIELTFGPNYGAYYLLKTFLRKPLLSKKVLWCAKTFPTHQEYLGLQSLFPEVKFIFLIRNGIDQISSTISCWPGKPFEECCTEWRDQFTKYAYAWDNPNCLILKHEDIVENPEPVMTRVFDFCKVPQNDSAAIYLRSKKVNTTNQTSDNSIKSYIRNSQSAFNDWSDKERSMFKEVCGEAMDRFHYFIPF